MKAAKAIGNLAHPTDGYGNLTTPIISKPTQLFLHAGLGAATASFSGDDVLSGAVAGVAGEVTGEYLRGGVVDGLMTRQTAVQIAGLAGGAASLLTSVVTDQSDERSANNIFAGQRIGGNAAENNALMAAIFGKSEEKKFDKNLKETKEEALNKLADEYTNESNPLKKAALATTLGAGSVLIPESATEIEFGIVTGGLSKAYAEPIAAALNKIDSSFDSLIGKLFGRSPESTTSLSTGIVNPIPEMFARVVPGASPLGTLGIPNSTDVFVTDAKILQGLDPSQISRVLAVEQNKIFTIIEFPSKGIQGIATPLNRDYSRFINGGRTGGGAPEFVIPNTKIPDNAIIKIVK